MTYLTDSPIDTDELVASVMRAGDGAAVIFQGVVRNHNQGHEVDWIDYEAYRPMAEKEFAAVVAGVNAEWPAVAVAVQHRLGRLSVGDASIVIVCVSPHRRDAFEACRAVIDRVKERVPIWKKEHGPNGEEWVGWQK